MSRGVAGSDWKSLENNENRLQHAQHENGREIVRPIPVCF
jgi:hypothetical protein